MESKTLNDFFLGLLSNLFHFLKRYAVIVGNNCVKKNEKIDSLPHFMCSWNVISDINPDILKNEFLMSEPNSFFLIYVDKLNISYPGWANFSQIMKTTSGDLSFFFFCSVVIICGTNDIRVMSVGNEFNWLAKSVSHCFDEVL